jgi:hypothetical protein
MLMLLFPVVSATDDLHAMRPEIEESNPSKQIARQVDGGSSSAINIAGGLPALLMPVSIANVELRTIGVLSNGSVVVGTQTRLGPDSGRAPPSA